MVNLSNSPWAWTLILNYMWSGPTSKSVWCCMRPFLSTLAATKYAAHTLRHKSFTDPCNTSKLCYTYYCQRCWLFWDRKAKYSKTVTWQQTGGSSSLVPNMGVEQHFQCPTSALPYTPLRNFGGDANNLLQNLKDWYCKLHALWQNKTANQATTGCFNILKIQKVSCDSSLASWDHCKLLEFRGRN